MSKQIMFSSLPETFPEKDKLRGPTFLGAVAFHAVLIGAFLLIPLFLSQKAEPLDLISLLVSTAPLPPAPPAAVPAGMPGAKPKAPRVQAAVEKPANALIAPVSIPRDIAQMIDQSADSPAPVAIGGVLGGLPGGVQGGVIGGIFAADASMGTIAPPPPPPAPAMAAVRPSGPIRVGGAVRPPQIVKLVQPVYPKLALMAHVGGTVVLEATLTTDGKVDKIQVISGNPLLVNAAIDSVKQWQYQPSYLNGQAVSVILDATVSFNSDSAQTGL